MSENWPPDELRSLFPLPLTPFELLMLHGEARDYPMDFQMRLSFRGRLDPQAWQRAVETAARRHPLLLAKVERSPAGFWQWQLPPGEIPQLKLGDQNPAAERLPEPVEPHRAQNLKMWGRIADERSDVTLFFHHVASDGMGALSFLRDLFACYAADRQGTSVALPPLDPRLWLSRGDLRPQKPGAAAPSSERNDLRETLRFLLQRPHRLNEPPWFSSIPGSEAPCLVREASWVKELAASAKQAGVTMNDLLLRDLFLAIRDWHTRKRGKPARGWVRVSIPTDQRGPADAAMPGTNKIGFAFLSRKDAAFADSAALLASIRDETRAIKEHGYGANFVWSLAAAQKFGLTGLLARDRAFGTAILSNLGPVARHLAGDLPVEDGRVRVGDLVLDNYVAVPPARPGTGPFIVVGSYADRLTVAMRSDPRILDRAGLAEFMEMYLQRLAQSAGTPG
jgi:hypothetical protein